MTTIEAADRIAIRDLIDRYALGVTTCDAALIASVFTPDGEWRVSPPLERSVDGAETIGTTIVSGLARFEFLMQMVHSVVIDIASDTATARSVMEERGRIRDGGGGVQMLGIYHDDLVRTPDGWRFKRRFFAPANLDMTAPGGDAVGTGGRAS